MSEIENGNQEATAPAGNSVDDILATFDLELWFGISDPVSGHFPF